MFSLQLVQRGRVGVSRFAFQRPRQVAGPREMALMQHLGLTGVRQPVQRVPADGLEQPVTSRGVPVDQRLVDQPGQHIQSGPVVHRIERGNRVRGVHSEATGEDAQAAEQYPFLRSQKLVGPVHRSAKCHMAWHHAPAAGGEEPEAVVEGGRDALGGQAPHPDRRELQGQRYAVKLLADPGHRWGVLAGHAKIRIGLHRPLDEQPDGVVVP